MNEIKKPIIRTKFRKYWGKQYYILKRKVLWVNSQKNWAKDKSNTTFTNKVFQHKSMIMRPLKDVEMYLQENKKTNLHLAIQHLHNLIIKPNETLSFWKSVGKPSARKGYLEGLVLDNGKISKGIGGGLCQLGNLLFWIFAHSPLKITERYRHGFDVFPDINRKVPFGAGATLSYNYIDLQVLNPTKYSFHLKLWLDEKYLNGSLSVEKQLNETYSIEERNHIMKQQIWGGYSRHNQIFKITQSKDNFTEELLVENHAIMMYNPFLEA